MSGGQRVNAGGILPPEEVIGRDAIVTFCWRTLQSQGLYLTGERRMGKSSIVRDKMGGAPPAGVQLIYLDVSDADTPLAFVDSLLREAKRIASFGGKFKLTSLDAARHLLPGLDLLKIVKLPAELAPQWKQLLRFLLADFAGADIQLILAFDELPLMLDKVRRGPGEAVAMDLLDTLRKERQNEPRLRMIYTGSLGLHHVLTGLQTIHYQNSPVNDMKLVEIPPLAEEDATDLAWRLLNGMGINTPDKNGPVARHLARITNGMPFYIQHLVGAMAETSGSHDETMADRLLTQRLTDLTDPWDFGYYKTRIDTHYLPQHGPVALALLDVLALAPDALAFDDLVGGLDPNKVPCDDETALRVIELLGKDHYISQNEEGALAFRYPLIARAWTYRRNLLGRRKRA